MVLKYKKKLYKYLKIHQPNEAEPTRLLRSGKYMEKFRNEVPPCINLNNFYRFIKS